MHTDYVSMGGKIFFTPLFLPYIRSTLEVHFFDFILGRATPAQNKKKIVRQLFLESKMVHADLVGGGEEPLISVGACWSGWYSRKKCHPPGRQEMLTK